MVKLPPPIWGLIYLLALAGLSWTLGWPLGLRAWPIGAALVVLGAALAVWGRLLFAREGAEIRPDSPSNSKLVTSGPFAFTRNPMYLGLVTVALGVALGVGAWPMLAAPVLLFATANWVHIPFEEAKMRRQFGEAYDAYVGRVRRWI